MEKHFPGRNDAKKGGEECKSYDQYINIQVLISFKFPRVNEHQTGIHAKGEAIFFLFFVSYSARRQKRQGRT